MFLYFKVTQRKQQLKEKVVLNKNRKGSSREKEKSTERKDELRPTIFL